MSQRDTSQFSKVKQGVNCQTPEELGFMFDIVNDGLEAVNKLSSSDPGYYSLILMDIQMPVMGGLDATKEIRKLANKELANIPIIAATANVFKEDIEAEKEAGMDAHVSKPYNVSEIVETITKVLTNK